MNTYGLNSLHCDIGNLVALVDTVSELLTEIQRPDDIEQHETIS
ncbi:hypothetical protein [Allomesorhizobium camelthorni]|nr:hypothetical protein [Mesorhizobium camelthorni]